MKRLSLAALFVALAIVLFFWSKPPDKSPSVIPGAATSSSTTSAPGSGSQLSTLNSQLPGPTERSPLADTLNSPTTDIRADLRVVTDILATFRTNFPHDGNPVGNNAEITAVLTGKNKLRLSLIPADLPAINARGELCDRWGTPFFFHAESGTQMTVRSAGPDKTLYTADDIASAP